MVRKDKRAIVDDVRNPLGFFVVALLVIEAAMCVGIAAARLTPELAFAALCLMAALFLVVVAAVTYITVKLPHHLYEQISRRLQSAEETREFVNSPALREFVQSVVEDTLSSGSRPSGRPIESKPEPAND